MQKDVVVDEELHSRQLALYGKQAMLNMTDSRVLICGLKGVGVEIAKNLALSGVKSIVLFDDGVVCIEDLSTQFLLSIEDVGKNRANCCISKIQQLNTSSQIQILSELPQIDSDLRKYNAIVTTDRSLQSSEELNISCRKNGVAFIHCETLGVFSSVFSDFGDKFVVHDTNGQEPKQATITGIQGNPTKIYICEEEQLRFYKGEFVYFKDVEGMEELNDQNLNSKQLKILSFDNNNCLTIDLDSTSFGKYSKGGIVVQRKQPKELNFKPLSQCLKNAGEIRCLGDNTEDQVLAKMLHVGIQGLDEFFEKYRSLPTPGDLTDEKMFLEIIQDINKDQTEKLSENIIQQEFRRIIQGGQGQLNPTSAIAGGVAAQEVLKFLTGKFHPLHQWFYFSSQSSLPNNPVPKFVNQNLRYNNQIKVMGNSVQKSLLNLKVFLIGAGALGCEFLKNFALMGIGSGEEGMIFVSDDDVIEKSNLTRQFLFRQEHISQSKSEIAAEEAKKINPQINIRSFQLRVNKDSEITFNHDFWEELDFVVNAQDNAEARIYADSKCRLHSKPLLNSGTHGPLCTTDTVVPHCTENYTAEIRSNPNDQFPMCTLRSFPYNIRHCLALAKNLFDEYFCSLPQQLNLHLQNQTTEKNDVQSLLKFLSMQICFTFDDCIRWGLEIFQELFHDGIVQLVEDHPEDQIVENCLFWSPPKRFPQPIKFDKEDHLHLSFVQAAAILNANLLDINIPNFATETKNFKNHLNSMNINGVKQDNYGASQKDVQVINQTDLQLEQEGQDDGIKLLTNQLAKLDIQNICLNPIQFEKDDDQNYHVQFVWGLANIRARNYKINEIDKFQAKVIVGRIVPAIVTSTAIAAGLVCFEIYKLVQQKKIQDLRCSAVNLATCRFLSRLPSPPIYTKFQDQKWSVWDTWKTEGDITVKQFVGWLDGKGFECHNIIWGEDIIFSAAYSDENDLNTKISELVQKFQSVEEGRRKFVYVSAVCTTKDEEQQDIQIPPIKVTFQ